MSSCQHPFQEILAKCDRAPSKVLFGKLLPHDRSTIWTKSRLPGWWPTWHRHSPAKIDLNSVHSFQHLGLADYKVPQAKQLETICNIARQLMTFSFCWIFMEASKAFVLQDNDENPLEMEDKHWIKASRKLPMYISNWRAKSIGLSGHPGDDGKTTWWWWTMMQHDDEGWWWRMMMIGNGKRGQMYVRIDR